MSDVTPSIVAELDEYFERLLARCADAPPRLIEAMRYSLSAGGKRLRPMLVMACFDACVTLDPAAAAKRPTALAAAAAIEMVHTFSLIHDDLPAMDDDDLRRGKPTNHKVFGEAMAILAGDALVALAFETIARDAAPERVGPLVLALAFATGPAGMIGGQVLDIEGENETLSLDELKQVHGLKTGALLAASCRCGALAADAPAETVMALDKFGSHLGLAFQIIDDILDVTASPEQMGKATKKDAGRGKNTYPAALGLDGARREADRQRDLALRALLPLGSAGATLEKLADRVVRRDH